MGHHKTSFHKDFRAWVALDRDGTVIEEKHYLSDPAGVELLPGALEGLRRLRELGCGLILVTNQSPIGRGIFDEARLGEIHARLNELRKNGGVSLDGIYFCPHTPNDTCRCRKPLPGMLEQAASEHDFDVASCFIIGDKECDVELARGASATGILVRTGYGAKEEARGVHADFVVDDLKEAARVIEKALEARKT